MLLLCRSTYCSDTLFRGFLACDRYVYYRAEGFRRVTGRSKTTSLASYSSSFIIPIMVLRRWGAVDNFIDSVLVFSAHGWTGMGAPSYGLWQAVFGSAVRHPSRYI